MVCLLHLAASDNSVGVAICLYWCFFYINFVGFIYGFAGILWNVYPLFVLIWYIDINVIRSFSEKYAMSHNNVSLYVEL